MKWKKNFSISPEIDELIREDNKTPVSIREAIEEALKLQHKKLYGPPYDLAKDLTLEPNENCKVYKKFKKELLGGYKEQDGKLNYELDWEFIEDMAKRMQANKGDKYPPYNWKKPLDVEGLKQALTRHFVEVMKGNYRDEQEKMGHLTALAINAMLINYQLKLKEND